MLSSPYKCIAPPPGLSIPRARPVHGQGPASYFIARRRGAEVWFTRPEYDVKVRVKFQPHYADRLTIYVLGIVHIYI